MTNGVLTTGDLGAGVLVGREPSVERAAWPVRLRLFCPLLGTVDVLDGGTNDIVDNDVKTIGGNVVTRNW